VCLAVPMRITAIDGPLGVIEADGLVQRTNLMLVPDAAVGDYVLVHAGFAIARLDDAEAAERLDLFGELTALAEDEADQGSAGGDERGRRPGDAGAPDHDPSI